MSDYIEATFELGEIVVKTLLEVEDSKRESPVLLRSLGGHEQERIILQKIGKYWNSKLLGRPDGLFVITNHRLVFLTKLKTITTTTDYLSFPLGRIDNVRTKMIMFVSPAIQFRFASQEYVFTFLWNSKEVAKALMDTSVDLRYALGMSN